MTGKQPADKNTYTVLVPNLFGSATTDPDAYWVSFDWAEALATAFDRWAELEARSAALKGSGPA